MSKTLTNASVEKLKADPNQRREIPDANVKGLYLIIHPTGRKVFALRTRRPGGRTAKITLGPVDLTRNEDGDPIIGSPLSLRAARVLATQLLHQRAKGVDLGEVKAKTLAGDEATFLKVATDFIAQHAKVRTRSWREAARLLGLLYPKDGDGEPLLIKGSIAERWSSIPIISVTGDQLHHLIEETTKKQTPGIKPKKDGRSDARGRRLAKVLSKLFSWATQRRLIAINPCIGLHVPPSADSRERVLTDAELRALWHSLDQFGPQFASVIRLLVLLGQRRQETAEMRFSELSEDGTTWTIPSSRTKAKRSHVVPLPEMAQQIINSTPKFANSDFVFSVTGATGLNGFSAAKVKLDGLLRLNAEWRFHDLRRTCISGMAALGTAPHVCEAVANHQSGFRSSVSGSTYNRYTYGVEKRAALELWADRVAKVIESRVA